MVKAEQEERLPYFEILLIGVGTVFGTMLLIVCFWSATAGWDMVPGLLVYGVEFSVMVCLVALLPSVALWRILVLVLRAAGIGFSGAVLISACITAFAVSTIILWAAGVIGNFDSFIRVLATALASVACTLVMFRVLFHSDKSGTKN